METENLYMSLRMENGQMTSRIGEKLMTSRFTEKVWQMEVPEEVTVIWRGEESSNFLPVRILSNGQCQYYDYQHDGKKEWQEDDHPAMIALSKFLVGEKNNE